MTETSSRSLPTFVAQSVPAGSVRYAVRLSSWRLEAEPKSSMEFNFLLKLVSTDAERAGVLRFVRAVDQKRALLSRLLAQHVCTTVLGLAPAEVVIERTAGRKPFAARSTSPGGLRNFNFNVSHEGDFVVVATEATCLCGVDVCSADQLRLGPGATCDQLRDLMGPLLSGDEWRRLERVDDDRARLGLFKTFWSCKEAFVKARGDGLQFDLARADFEPVRFDDRGRWRQAALRLDGFLDPDWRFDLEALDDSHICTVALGPAKAALDANGKFKATLIGPRSDRDDLCRPRPRFRVLAVGDLVPPQMRRDFADLRVRCDIPADLPRPPSPTPSITEPFLPPPEPPTSGCRVV